MEQQIEKLLQEMTLEEKIGMIHGAGLFRTQGVERLGIPELHMSDGPMGVRCEFLDLKWEPACTTEDMVTYLPSNSALASTWNRRLAKEAGNVLGEEARGRKKDVILAPGINIKRSPLCGRNFEYMSEDPCLVEEMAVPFIEGVQENDVSACVKHFAANSQETERLWVDTVVDERTLQEIYFPGFLAAVQKGKSYAVMGAYNRLNGEHCCTGKSLLNKTLREDWNYDGAVISDWGGVHDTTLAAESALDLEMDVTYEVEKHYMADALLEKVKSGEIKEELVDEKVRHLLRLMYRLNMIGDDAKKRKAGAYNTREHQQAVLDVARESVILLKNAKKHLPLDASAGKKIAVIGRNAVKIHANGGGSAEIKALYEISPLLGIKSLLGGNVEIFYAPGYDVPYKEAAGGENWQAESTKEDSWKPLAEWEPDAARQEAFEKEALALAKECDEVIFIGGLNHEFDIEGRDRTDMKLPYGQDVLIEKLLEVKPDMTVVLYAGSPVEMPWAEKVENLIWCYYAGMEGGRALAEVLFGKVNPSGKLAETMIQTLSDCPAHVIGTFGKTDVVEYKEGVMVGYRYYDTEEIPVNFCFGHGLSYTDFSYEKLEITPLEASARCGKRVAAEEGLLRVTVTFKNVGARAGAEVVQIYLAPHTECNVERPAHELKAFEKVELLPGEEREVTLTLTEKDFAYYDVEEKAFMVDCGEYEIQAAASSRDIRRKETYCVK